MFAPPDLFDPLGGMDRKRSESHKKAPNDKLIEIDKPSPKPRRKTMFQSPDAMMSAKIFQLNKTEEKRRESKSKSRSIKGIS